MWIMLLFDDKEFFFVESKFLIPLYIAGEKKENENIGLDFPITTENRLNLSTIAHVIRIIFCILSVWLFSFFGVVRFPSSSSVFFSDAPSSSFFSFFFFCFFKTPFFFIYVLCMAVYGYVWLRRSMQGYVWLCMGMQGYVGLCRAVYGCVWLCRAMQDYVHCFQ